MKMYKKSDLTLVNGMLVCESTGDIVIPDPRIVEQANELETLAQKTSYLTAQPAATPMPSLDGFERLSIKDKLVDGAQFEATTLLLDIEAAKTMKMMDELDDMHTVEAANMMLAKFTDLLSFVNSDFVVDTGSTIIIPFDMPTLGNVLELRQKDITKVIAYASGLTGDNDCADCDDTDCALHPDNDDPEFKFVKVSSKEELEDLFDKMRSVFDNNDEDGSEE